MSVVYRGAIGYLTIYTVSRGWTKYFSVPAFPWERLGEIIAHLKVTSNIPHPKTQPFTHMQALTHIPASLSLLLTLLYSGQILGSYTSLSYNPRTLSTFSKRNDSTKARTTSNQAPKFPQLLVLIYTGADDDFRVGMEKNFRLDAIQFPRIPITARCFEDVVSLSFLPKLKHKF